MLTGAGEVYKEATSSSIIVSYPSIILKTRTSYYSRTSSVTVDTFPCSYYGVESTIKLLHHSVPCTKYQPRKLRKLKVEFKLR